MVLALAQKVSGELIGEWYGSARPHYLQLARDQARSRMLENLILGFFSAT